MTSKERVLCVVRHQTPDRVPTIYGDIRWVGLQDQPRVRSDGQPADQWGVVLNPRDGTLYGEIRHPVTSIEQLRSVPFPDPLRDDRWEGVAEAIARSRDDWSVTCLGPTLWERMHFLCGMENAMMWLYEYPDNMAVFADRIVDYHLAEIERLGAMGLDCIWHQDDWGTQQGIMISPDLWREFFKPRYARLFRRCHDLGMANFLHSCGNILEIIPDLAQIGLDIQQVQQTDTMGLETLLDVCRDRVSLSLMPDIQRFLPTATVVEVRREAEKILRLSRVEHGWMMADTYRHWPEGIPPANIQAWEDVVAHWSFPRPSQKE